MKLTKTKFLKLLLTGILTALAWCFSLSLFPAGESRPEQEQMVSRELQWDRIFDRRSGWTGGDVGASFLIPGNRVLWVFGDSWVGRVKNNQHIQSVLVNNSIAVHPYAPKRPGKAPFPWQVRFYWGPREKSRKPTAWVRPPVRDSGTWYWPTGGGAVWKDANDNSRLALFLIELKKSPGDNSVWGFQTIGNALAVIDNVKKPGRLWKVRLVEVPFFKEPAGPKEGSYQIEWGVACISVPVGSFDYLYIYGTKSDQKGQRDLVLSRVQPRELENFSQWKFFAGEENWQKSQSQALSLVKEVPTELSIETIPSQNRGIKYVMVYSEPFLGARILVRTAEKPEGPWSEPKPIFTVPEVLGSKTKFAYAGKSHSHLSKPGTLLISYIVNSHNFNELINDASIYKPKFISVPLREIEKIDKMR